MHLALEGGETIKKTEVCNGKEDIQERLAGFLTKDF